MVQGFVAHFSRLDEDLEVRSDFALSRKVRKAQGTQGVILLFLGHLVSDIEVHNS